MSEEQVMGNWFPSEMSEGGMLDDKDVTLRDVKFVEYDYEGKSEKGPVPCFSFIPEDEEGNLGERRQYYSAGQPEFWEIAEEGEKVVSISSNVTKLSKKSNCGRFMVALEEAGFDFSLVDLEKISSMNGLKVHFNQIPKDTGKGYHLLPTAIVDVSALGGGSKKSIRKGRKGKKSTATATTADNGSEVTFSMEDFSNRLTSALDNYEDGIPFKSLLKVMKEDPAFANVVGDKAYLIEGRRCVVDEKKTKELVEVSGLVIEDRVISLV